MKIAHLIYEVCSLHCKIFIRSLVAIASTLNTTEIGDIISDLEIKHLAMFHSTQVPPCALNSKAPCISTLQDGTIQIPESGHIRHVASHLNCPVLREKASASTNHSLSPLKQCRVLSKRQKPLSCGLYN